ncbi:flagellar motor switch protein FliM [Oscillospiraceae bacterium LTW-04]|nr:flagellar motor switch protein FliM [Oscillospiraceae bacterium MB24-C1]
MPEILSQSQIDALLKGMSSGNIDVKPETPEKRIKEYDFYSPKKFTKEQLRNVDSIHENLARLLSSYFSGSMRINSEVNLLQVEEQRYYEFNNALPDTALIGLMELKPGDKNINDFTMMLDASSNLAFFMIDRLLGGVGSGVILNRDYTDIELGIMRNIFQKFSVYMQDAWRDYIDVDISLDTIETNPRLIQIYAPEDIVVIVSFEVKMQDVIGTINICIPAIGLEELMGSFVSKYSRISKNLSDDAKKEMAKKVIQRAIYASDLKINAVLDEVQMELEDILHLRVDDIIKLENAANGDVKILVDSQPWFYGKMGIVKTNKAIKVTRSYPPEALN